jgi:two-component system, NtrC family, nitrogen regulation sensor histidine kinase NtrY
MRGGLAGRVVSLVLVHVAVTASAAAAALQFTSSPAMVMSAALLAGALLAMITVPRSLAEVRRVLAALGDGVRSFRDADFSLRLTRNRDDEIGELVRLYNEMGDALRAERHDLYQRELLLDTVLQGAPIGILLEDRNGRLVFANRTARDLLGVHGRLEGRLLSELGEKSRPELQDALQAPGDTLFTVGGEGEEETYRTVRRPFQVNMRRHVLHVIERLTPELRRHEVEVWKQAIRVMSHELNNSLAPIRSLAHSARQAAARPEHASMLEPILGTIEERASHLAHFLEGYARFARLPRPRPEPVPWSEFLDGVQALAPFRLEGAPPAEPGWFDPAQMQQVLINLLKNAHEAGGDSAEVAVSVHPTPRGETALRVVDRGRGMDAAEMKRALLPFYTSKPAGTGVGLALCKEIIEAHGGRLRLQNRPGGGLMVTCWLAAGTGLSRPAAGHAAPRNG